MLNVLDPAHEDSADGANGAAPFLDEVSERARNDAGGGLGGGGRTLRSRNGRSANTAHQHTAFLAVARTTGEPRGCAFQLARVVQDTRPPATVQIASDRPTRRTLLAPALLVFSVILSLATPAGAGEVPASRETCPLSSVAPPRAGAATASAVARSAESRATINDQWEVVTFVHLRARGDTQVVRFRITELPVKGKLLDFRNSEWCQVPSRYVTQPSHYLRHALRYVPDRNRVGQDTFAFRVVDADRRESTDAVATIEIERGGLRWYTTMTGSSGLSDQRPNTKALDLANPEAIGKSAQEDSALN